MSYDIFIGNAYLDPDYDEYNVRVERATHPDAPMLPPEPDGRQADMSGKGNSRHPGYSQMRFWTQEMGIEDLWYNEETGILAQHPGIIKLRPCHLETINAALKRHPDDFRLSWYAFWMKWSLENCRFPAIYNS